MRVHRLCTSIWGCNVSHKIYGLGTIIFSIVFWIGCSGTQNIICIPLKFLFLFLYILHSYLLTHYGLMMPCMVVWMLVNNGSGNGLLSGGTKPLPGSVLTLYRLNSWEQTSAKFKSKYKTFFLWWKYIGKCWLSKVRHFIQEPTSQLNHCFMV